MGDDGVGHAVFADVGGERPGIDAADADDAAFLQPVREMAGGAPVGRCRHGRMHHTAAHAGLGLEIGGFLILGIDADVADVREGEGDDLIGIGRVGEDLLISGHGRVETNLAGGLARGAKAVSLNHRAVGKHENGCMARRRPGGGLGVRHGRRDLLDPCRFLAVMAAARTLSRGLGALLLAWQSAWRCSGGNPACLKGPVRWRIS